MAFLSDELTSTCKLGCSDVVVWTLLNIVTVSSVITWGVEWWADTARKVSYFHYQPIPFFPKETNRAIARRVGVEVAVRSLARILVNLPCQ